MADKVPGKAWVVVFAGMAVNLCLGILYAWSVWSKALIDESKALAGVVQEGLNAGWPYLTNSEAATPFSLCVIIFTLLMIPGGKIQDKLGPKVGAITGGLFLAVGCIIAGPAEELCRLDYRLRRLWRHRHGHRLCGPDPGSSEMVRPS